MTEQLPRIVLTPQYLTHVDLVDDQHRFLVAMFNRLVDNLENSGLIPQKEDIFAQLSKYTEYHFSTEEQVMEQQSYPDIDYHKAQHEYFVSKLKSLSSEIASEPTVAVKLAGFLAKWFQNHIFVADKKLGAFLATDREGPKPADTLEVQAQKFMAEDPEQARRNASTREVTVHRLWLSGRSPRAGEFEFKDMSGLDLQGVDLTSAVLTGANLERSNLRGAILTNADLSGADLEQADLTDANLTGANLRGANLHRATLTAAILRGADLCPKSVGGGAASVTDIDATPTMLTEAKLERAILCNAKLTGCDFSGADMAEADLAGADLTGAVMLGADLHGARFDGANLRGAVIDLGLLDEGAVQAIAAAGGSVEPARKEISAEEFLEAIKQHEVWIESGGQDGLRIDFDRMSIPAVTLIQRRLSGCRMRHCSISGGEWPGVDMRMADLSYSDMRRLNLSGALLMGITMRRVNLSDANLSAARFDALPLAGGNRMWPANLEGALLRRTKLSNASLDGGIFRRTDLTGSVMDGISVRKTDFQGAKR